mgnify:CR=1 FL=1
MMIHGCCHRCCSPHKLPVKSPSPCIVHICAWRIPVGNTALPCVPHPPQAGIPDSYKLLPLSLRLDKRMQEIAVRLYAAGKLEESCYFMKTGEKMTVDVIILAACPILSLSADATRRKLVLPYLSCSTTYSALPVFPSAPLPGSWAAYLAERCNANDNEAYISCRIGLMLRRNPAEYGVRTAVLNERQRECRCLCVHHLP